MKMVSYRMKFERPDVGFDYLGSWHQEDIASALRDAQQHWKLDSNAKIVLQVSNGSGLAPKTLPLTAQSCAQMLQMDRAAQKDFMRVHRIQLNAQLNKNAALSL